MIQEISKTIKLLFQTLGLGTKVVVEEVKPYAKLYTKGLLWIAMIAVLSPIPFLIIGIALDLRWLIALTGIWWAFWTFLLLLMVSPIGILIESLTGGIKGSGQRYIKWVSGILLIGLCISLFASLIPIKENLSELPLLIVAAIILSLLNVWFFRRKVIASIVSVIFIALILSFYFPTTFETLKEKIRGIDISMAEPNRLYITDEDIKNERIKFFRSDGEPLIWYYRTGDGQFELFNRKGHHPIYKEKLKPVTPDVVDGIMKQLKAEVERRMQEEKKKREEAERLEREKKEEAERIAKQGVVETTELTNQQTEQNKFISLRLRQIWGVAYSYSKEKWAAGSYPEVRLSFVEGPFHAGTHIEWKGSQYFEGDQICLTISNLRLPKLVEGLEDFGFDYRPYYTDFGVGYFVQLDNAVFEEDYTLAKNIIISRTFKGDAPPKNIKKCFKVISIKKTDEKPYKISGEWKGTSPANIEDSIIVRIVQSGNKFDGSGIEFKKNGEKERVEIEGWIFGGKITFFYKNKNYEKYKNFLNVGCVAPFFSNSEELYGFCLWDTGGSNIKGEWRWRRKGDFTGSPEDILNPPIR